ncbi:hypothetical protein MMC21_001986 [Puttea exsequens]|nr:hypothetical protein [Puttea exsequens]
MAPIAILLHIVLETIAGFSFIRQPSSTLTAEQPHAHPLIRQYGLLLLLTNAIFILLFTSPTPLDLVLQQRVSGLLSFYHVGAFSRATASIAKGETGGALGGPWVHAAVHVVAGGMLAGAWLGYGYVRFIAQLMS